MSEKEIQQAIREELGNKDKYPKLVLWVNVCGLFTDRNNQRTILVGVGVPGGADLIGIYDGLFIGIEVKSPTGRQSDEQRVFEKLVKDCNGAYCLARSVADAVAFIARLDAARSAA